MALEDLAAHLVASGLGTLGSDLFLHVAPDKPDDLMVLVDYSGDPPDWVQEESKVEIENVRVQLMARSKQPQACKERADKAYQVLMEIQSSSIGGTRILWCKPVDAPAMIGRDENGRFMTTVNFRVAKELTSYA